MHSLAKTRMTEKIRELSWRCVDCDNLYGPEVEHCPNELMDQLGVLDLLDLSSLRRDSPSVPVEGDGCYEDLLEEVADALFNSWFPGTTVDDMVANRCYNGEHEIAETDARVALAAIDKWMKF